MEIAKLLSPQEVTAHWSVLRPMIASFCSSNEVAEGMLTPESIFVDVHLQNNFVVAMYDNEGLYFIIVLEFCGQQPDNLTANILGAAGRNLLKIRQHHWQNVLNWCKSLGAKTVETSANERLARIYQKKFRFNKSCVTLRLDLGENNE